MVSLKFWCQNKYHRLPSGSGLRQIYKKLHKQQCLEKAVEQGWIVAAILSYQQAFQCTETKPKLTWFKNTIKLNNSTCSCLKIHTLKIQTATISTKRKASDLCKIQINLQHDKIMVLAVEEIHINSLFLGTCFLFLSFCDVQVLLLRLQLLFQFGNNS